MRRKGINKSDFDKSRVHLVSCRVTTGRTTECVTSKLMHVKGMSTMIKKLKKIKILTRFRNKKKIM